jgi:hypothetical protein
VVVQLAMGLGVASAAALLGGFSSPQRDVLGAFQLTFLCLGGLSMLAAAIFLQLGKRDGMGGQLPPRAQAPD